MIPASQSPRRIGSSLRGPVRKLGMVVTGAAGVLLLFAACRDREPTAPMIDRGRLARDAAPPASLEVFIHGAPQSWQLFMGNVTAASLQSDRTVVMVHTTAGDGGNGPAFWQAREAGALASVDEVLQDPAAWSCGTRTINAHPIRRCTKANAVVYFMRMPDGNYVDGQGYGYGSLSRLRDQGTPTNALDGSTTYITWADFTGTLQALVVAESPGLTGPDVEVHTPDFDRTANATDHPDNFATADAVRVAIQGMGWTIAWYLDFATINLPVNLPEAERSVKLQVWTAYDNAMVDAGFASGAGDSWIQGWLQRTYFRVTATAPAAPSELAASAATKARINLQWRDNASGETGYQVERAPDVSGAPGVFERVATPAADAAAWADLALNPGTTYWYRVRTVSDGGVSGYAGPVRATTPLTTPLPYKAHAYVVAHEDDWQLFFGDRAQASFLEAATMLVVNLTAGDGGNPSDAFWQARERGAMATVDAIVGPGAWSCAARTVRTHPIQRCTKGGTIMYFLRMPDGNNVDGTGYGRGSLERLRDQGTDTRAIDGSTTYTTWSDFTKTVDAIINAEFEDQSAPWVQVHTQETSRTLDPGDHPDHNLTGDVVKAATAGDAWDVFWYVGYDTKNRAINLSGAQRGQKLAQFSAYDAVIVAAGFPSDAGNPDYQAWLWRTYGRRTVPLSASLAAPSALAAQPLSMSELALTWTDNSTTEFGFLIDRAPDNNGAPGTWAQVDSVGPNVVAYTSGGMEAGERYWLRVRAIDPSGTSPYSAPASAVTVPPPPPAAPSALTVRAASATQLNLAWTNNAGSPLTGFRIERAPDAGGAAGSYAEIATVGATARSYSNTGLTYSTTYWYRVRAYNNGGNSAYADAASAMTLSGIPEAPTNLIATTLSQTSIALDWTDNATNELGYQLELAPDVNGAPGTWTQFGSIARNSVTWNATGLTAGTKYWFRVYATYLGPSPYSNLASATTFPPNPAEPSGLVASPISSSAIGLTWTDNSTNETSFTIQRAPDNAGAAGTFATVGTVGAGVTTFTSTGLLAGTTYWHRVRANNAGGSSNYSAAASATTPGSAPPAGPFGLVAQAASATRIDLSWTDNATDEFGFRVERAPDNAGVPGTYAQVATLAANARSYSNTGLTKLTKYWYRVQAYGPGGDSPYTNDATATTLTGTPAAPTNLIATTLSQTSIALDWTDNATNELGYQLERATDVNGVPGTWTQFGSIAANSVTWNATGLTAGVKYWFRVYATYLDPSPYSNLATAYTLPASPDAPSGFTATPASGSVMNLAWTDNALNETSYTLQRALDNNGTPGSYTTVASLGANVTSYTHSGLAANTRYWYRLRANNSGGSSAWVVTSGTTPAVPPPAPTALTAKATTSATTATLAWTDNAADETGFRVEQAPDAGGAPGGWAEIATVGANVKAYTPTGLSGATTYWYRVRAYSAYGNSAYTNEGTMTTPLPTNLAVAATGAGPFTANLTWTAGVGAKVDVYRDGVKIKSAITNSGATTDGSRPAGSTSTYLVCNVALTGAAQCSNAVTITF